VTELTEAFMALPEAQRFAFTVWGARDPDSWLNRDARAGSGDQPLLFDAGGRPTSMHAAIVAGLTGAGQG
jgi:endo-1,4-beta-xylanase